MLHIPLEGTVLENIESITYLGVTITNYLRWNAHISNICTNANRTLGLLRRNLYAYAQSWNTAVLFGALGCKLEKVQNRAVRFVTGNYNDETGCTTGILEHLKWKSLNGGETVDSYCYTKEKASIPTDDLSPGYGLQESSFFSISGHYC